jgi:hypothetical protein
MLIECTQGAEVASNREYRLKLFSSIISIKKKKIKWKIRMAHAKYNKRPFDCPTVYYGDVFRMVIMHESTLTALKGTNKMVESHVTPP